jgi:hypothetical protein
MQQDLYPQPRRVVTILIILGWLLAVAVGAVLIWLGFQWSQVEGPASEPSPPAETLPVPTQVVASPTVMVVFPSPTPIPMLPTATPLPVASPLPTVPPATPTSAIPYVVAGEKGVNVRGGPGTNYALLGYLEPSARADLTGRYSDWWQISYNGASAWVFGSLVTATNADDVPQVQPPPAPPPPTAVPATAAPTAPPPTAAPSDYRGLVPQGFQVEGAPGPYGSASDIWFNIWINNTSGTTVEYDALGIFVEETGQFQRSYFSTPPNYPAFVPGQKFSHRDHINQFTLGPGTYHLSLMICFKDSYCPKMWGPVEVVVQ